MAEKAILAIEEALLANLFTQRALVELLIKKGIISREELEGAVLNTETEKAGIGKKNDRLYLLKRSITDRRYINKKTKKDRRKVVSRRNAS